MTPLSRWIFMLAVAGMPVLVIFIISPALPGGFMETLRLLGPALAIIYPPIAVWMMATLYERP